MRRDRSLGHIWFVPIPMWVAVIVVIASALGSYLAWLGYAHEANQRIDAKLSLVCDRQDRLVKVLNFIASPGRQERIPKQGSQAVIAASDAALRSAIDAVADSPCG
jgi:hypothetical protein